MDSSKTSIDLYEQIKQFNIVFIHSTSTNAKLNFQKIINRFIHDESNIIISADYNVYPNNHHKCAMTQNYINLLVPYYIDIIKNAKYIFIIDSCFSCIVIPLAHRNELNAIEYKIFDRTQPVCV